MSFIDFMFGRRRRFRDDGTDVLEHAPPGVWWREVQPCATAPAVRAVRADSSGELKTPRGPQRYSPGDYIVDHLDGDEAVVNAVVFEKSYRPAGEGRYRKRMDLVLRYFTLDHPVKVRTLEGVETAAAGDWIMEGVTGELWPVRPEVGQRKYKPL